MSTIKTVLDIGGCAEGTTAGNRLHNALEVLEAVNVAMAVATHALVPLADLDFHGKWRIQKAIRALGFYDPTRADAALALKILNDMRDIEDEQTC